MNNSKTYYAVNLKSPHIYFWFLIGFVISYISGWFAFVLIRDGEWKVALFTIPFIILFPFFVLHSLFSKIILTPDSIVRKTIFNRKELKYKEIKTLTRHSQSPGGPGRVVYFETKEKQKNSKSFFSLNVIFISIIENSNPDKFSKNKQFIFHETNDIYENLKERISLVNSSENQLN